MTIIRPPVHPAWKPGLVLDVDIWGICREIACMLLLHILKPDTFILTPVVSPCLLDHHWCSFYCLDLLHLDRHSLVYSKGKDLHIGNQTLETKTRKQFRPGGWVFYVTPPEEQASNSFFEDTFLVFLGLRSRLILSTQSFIAHSFVKNLG